VEGREDFRNAQESRRAEGGTGGFIPLSVTNLKASNDIFNSPSNLLVFYRYFYSNRSHPGFNGAMTVKNLEQRRHFHKF
jgi:hypothetical protein